MSAELSKTEKMRARAEAGFKGPEEPKTEVTAVMAEIGRNKVAEAAKTVRLRGLRLAKEETDRAEAALAPKPAGRRKPGVKGAK